ncbi:MAG: tetratricopeptide repeat protein, partial [Polyangiaceae bacterium]
MDSAPRSEPVSSGRHELVQRLAQGYLGGLWVARRGASTPGPALALVRRITLTNRIPEEAEQRLAESAWDAMGIRHDNVLRVSEVVHAERTLDVVYDYVDAQPLQSLMLRANIRRYLFPAPVALRIVADLLLGIEAMHRTASELEAGVGAGGLSPESVLVTREGNTLLCDALVASTAATIEEFGRNPAKLGYAAPEQLTMRTPPPATDVFGCAVLLWELLAARRFLLGPRPALERRLREHQLPDLRQSLKGDREIAPELIALIERALSADARERPAGPAELRQAILSCGQEVGDVRDVARYFADLTGTASERRPDPSLPPRADDTLHGLTPSDRGGVPSSENTPVARVSVAPTLDKVAAWLDNDEPSAHWTSRSSNYRPPGVTGRDDASEALPESTPQPSAPPPVTPPASRVAREKDKAEPSAAKPVALQATVPRASSQPSLIPKSAPRAPTPNPGKVAATKATTQPLRLSKAAPKPPSHSPLSSKVTPKPSSQSPLSRKVTPMPSSQSFATKPKAITQPALPKAKAASLAPAPPAASSVPAEPVVAVLTRPVLAIGEPLANPPSTEAQRSAQPEPPVAKSPASTPTLIGAPSLEPPPLPEPSPPPPQVTPTAPLLMEPSVVRHVVREIRAPRPTKTPTVPVSPLARSRSAPPPPHPPQPAEKAGFASVPAAIQSARDSNIPGAPPNPVVPKAPIEAPLPLVVPQLEHKLAASSRNKLLLAAAVVLGAFMLVLVLLKPAEPPWAGPGNKPADGTMLPSAPAENVKTGAIMPPAAATPAAAGADAGTEATPAASAAAGASDAGAQKLAAASLEQTAVSEAMAAAAGMLSGPLPQGALHDELLLAAFGAESQSDDTSCRDRNVVVSKAAAKKTPKSQLVIARRALVRGQRTRAHQILCEVSARDPKAAPLQRDLTDLALRVGDGEQAQFLAERALGRKKDPVLLGLWGDALAQTHNIPVARDAWLSLLDKGDEARRGARLASAFSGLGQRALKKKNYSDAQRFFRRALILGKGDAAAGLGYGEALLRLGESRAALVWLERAGQTFPKDAQAQALLGEALYETGDAAAAKKAFKSAVSLRPKDQKLRRRIAR